MGSKHFCSPILVQVLTNSAPEAFRLLLHTHCCQLPSVVPNTSYSDIHVWINWVTTSSSMSSVAPVLCFQPSSRLQSLAQPACAAFTSSAAHPVPPSSFSNQVLFLLSFQMLRMNVRVYFICQIDWPIVPSYFVKQYSVCFCEDVFF